MREFTGVEDGLSNEKCHDFGQGSVILSASIQDVFDDFAQLVHLYFLIFQYVTLILGQIIIVTTVMNFLFSPLNYPYSIFQLFSADFIHSIDCQYNNLLDCVT